MGKNRKRELSGKQKARLLRELRLIGQNVLVGSLLRLGPGVWVGAGVVELVPDCDGAHDGQADVTLMALAVSRCLVERTDLGLGGHGLQDYGRTRRRLGMHVAPPHNRFDTPLETHSPMITQQGTQLGVDPALDPVVGCRQRHRQVGRGSIVLGVNKREQGRGTD